jgi:hypothetical protein
MRRELAEALRRWTTIQTQVIAGSYLSAFRELFPTGIISQNRFEYPSGNSPKRFLE